MVSLQAVIRDTQIKLSVNTYEENLVKSIQTSATRVKHSNVTTSNIYILEPHSFEYQ